MYKWSCQLLNSTVLLNESQFKKLTNLQNNISKITNLSRSPNKWTKNHYLCTSLIMDRRGKLQCFNKKMFLQTKALSSKPLQGTMWYQSENEPGMSSKTLLSVHFQQLSYLIIYKQNSSFQSSKSMSLSTQALPNHQRNSLRKKCKTMVRVFREEVGYLVTGVRPTCPHVQPGCTW